MASSAASLWAAIEIVLGSFLHNLRIPFSGSILTFFSIGLISGFVQLWPYKGLIWRTGLITALLKSVSPSHIILGPMIGILSEAFLMELCLRMMGNNLLGIMAGGMFSMNASLIHKIINLLILYSWNITHIYLNLYNWLSKQVAEWLPNDPIMLLIILPISYALLGAYAGWLGHKAGKQAFNNPLKSNLQKESALNASHLFKIPENLKPIPALVPLHIVSLVVILFLFSFHHIITGFTLSSLYLIFAAIRYKEYLRRFKKPALWLQFMAILAMTLIFGSSLTTKSHSLEENLIAGLTMIARATILITSLSCLMAEIHSPVIQILTTQSPLKDLVRAIEASSATIPWILTQLPPPKKALRNPLATLKEILQLTQFIAQKETASNERETS